MTEHIRNVPDNLTDCRGHYVYVSYSTVLNINARHGETERDMSAQHHLLIVHDIQSGGESAYVGAAVHCVGKHRFTVRCGYAHAHG